MTLMPASKQAWGLLGWLGISFAAAALGGIASSQAGTFYRALDRPGWAPPAWLFAPVWSALYLLMGVAAWLIWRRHGFLEGAPALRLFLVQLALNALWTWVFFAWHQGALAFLEILALWVSILATVVLFWRLQPLAAALLVPYLVWVTFATALTYAMWKGNPGLLT